MALVVADRVKEVTTTTGTGAISLGGAQTNFVTFSSALSDGDTTYYAIVDNNNIDYEVGLGTYTSSGNTLARTTILDSSNGGSAVNLSSGQKDVFITYPADKSLKLDANDKIAGDQTFSGTVTLNANPASGLQAATKQYVDDTAAEGIQYHSPVRVEKEGNLNATYDNGTAGVGATLTNAGTQAALVIDDITMVVSDRVLVYEQTDATQNGVYTVTNVGSASTNWVLTRSTDTDSYAPSDPNALAQGSGFFVEEGTLGAGEKYVCNTVGTITFGTTDITFVQVASAQVYTAGTGIDISGSVISSDATLQEVTTSGATTTDTITVGGLVAASLTYPSSDGSAEQFLKTNGSGTLTFADVPSGIESSFTIRTANFTASAGVRYYLDTSGGSFTMTLPASPTAGDQVAFVDYGGNFATNAAVLDRNGSNLMGLAENMNLDVDNFSGTVEYVDATQGWVLI